MLSKEEFRGLQQAYLKMAKEFHLFCLDNNISYCLTGGSALGCVRHGGFIPWDVDIDIALLRSDYDKLESICLKNGYLPGFKYVCYKNNPNHDMPHALICLEDSEICFHNPKRVKPLYLDIFSLDSVPDNKNMRDRQAKEIALYKKLISGKRYAKRKDISLFRRAIKLISYVALKPLSWQRLHYWGSKIMTRYSDVNTKQIANMAGRYSYEKETINRKVIGTPVLTDFDGIELYIPEDVVSLLEHLYGNYMQLPSEEEQQSYRCSVDYYRLPADN